MKQRDILYKMFLKCMQKACYMLMVYSTRVQFYVNKNVIALIKSAQTYSPNLFNWEKYVFQYINKLKKNGLC